MNDMIAYCGLNCEKCDAYIATVNDDDKLREKTARLWAELNNAPILPEHINCQGCRVDGMKTVFCENLCPIRQCALKHKVTTCGDCSEVDTCQTVRMVIGNNPETCKNLGIVISNNSHCDHAYFLRLLLRQNVQPAEAKHSDRPAW